MSGAQDSGTNKDLAQIYGLWWLHDARWYQTIAKRYGFSVANEINREVLQQVAHRVSTGVARKLGRSPASLSFAELVDAFCSCVRIMWPEDMLSFQYQITGPGEFSVDIDRNFALEMLRRAGTVDQYECPCLELREGWFKGLGVKPTRNCIVQCLKSGASSCRIEACVPGFSHASASHDRSSGDGE